MAKYVRSGIPKHLNKDCIVIHGPDYTEQIAACKKKRPRNGLTTVNYLKEVIAAIGDKYFGEDFNAVIGIKYSRFRGLPFENDGDVDEIVKRILQRSYPEATDRFMDYHIKHRPHGTKLIYFTGDHLETGAFALNGIDEIQPKEVNVYLGLEKKKTVGKPFKKATDEQK